jgi:hypothetical protein
LKAFSDQKGLKLRSTEPAGIRVFMQQLKPRCDNAGIPILDPHTLTREHNCMCPERHSYLFRGRNTSLLYYKVISDNVLPPEFAPMIDAHAGLADGYKLLFQIARHGFPVLNSKQVDFPPWTTCDGNMHRFVASAKDYRTTAQARPNTRTNRRYQSIPSTKISRVLQAIPQPEEENYHNLTVIKELLVM